MWLFHVLTFLWYTNHLFIYCFKKEIIFFLSYGDRDGRIKVIGGDNIEALFTSPKQSPYKYLEVCSFFCSYVK